MCGRRGCCSFRPPFLWALILVVYFRLSCVGGLLNCVSSSSSRTSCCYPSAPSDRNSTAVVNEDFPYLLACNKSELFEFLISNGFIDSDTGQKQDITILLVYHVGMINNWRTVLKDQLVTLLNCGLYDIADEVMISYSNNEEQAIFDEIQKLFSMMNVMSDELQRFTSKIYTSKGIKSPWEAYSMNRIYEFCSRQSQPEKAVVFYFHNKGISRWRSNWRANIGKPFTYSQSLYWRNYMEYFLLERPHLCLAKILQCNASTCGVSFQSTPKFHYSGNFWSSSCHHITRRLAPINVYNDRLDYLAAEMWIGNYPEATQDLHVSLFSHTRNFYQSLILPNEYVLDYLHARFDCGQQNTYLLNYHAKHSLNTSCI